MTDQDLERAPTVVPAEAIAYWRAKGLRPSFSWLDVYGEEHRYAFTAAKFVRRDVLKLMREELDKAIAGGLTFEAFRAAVGPRLEAAGFWGMQQVPDPESRRVVDVHVPSRLARIFDTNMRTARAQGQYDRIQRTKRSRPYLLYQVGPSERHRPEHLAWHGLLLPVDDPFWSAHFPPNGYGCKCGVRSVSEREAGKLEADGLPAPDPEPVLDDQGNPTGHVVNRRVPVRRTAPPVQLVTFENKRTGEVVAVPKGIQPGFEHTPGEGRKLALPPGGGDSGPAKPQPVQPAPRQQKRPVRSFATVPDRAPPHGKNRAGLEAAFDARDATRTALAAKLLQNIIRDRYGLAKSDRKIVVSFHEMTGPLARVAGYISTTRSASEADIGLGTKTKGAEGLRVVAHEVVHGLGGVGSGPLYLHQHLAGAEEWATETLAQHYMGSGADSITAIDDHPARKQPLLKRVDAFEESSVEFAGGVYRTFRARVAAAISHAENTLDTKRVTDMTNSAAMLWKRKAYATREEAENALIEAMQPDTDEKRAWYRAVLIEKDWGEP